MKRKRIGDQRIEIGYADPIGSQGKGRARSRCRGQWRSGRCGVHGAGQPDQRITPRNTHCTAGFDMGDQAQP
jgi:hypothetical protein